MIEFETAVILTAVTLDLIGHMIFYKLLLRRERAQKRIERRLTSGGL